MGYHKLRYLIVVWQINLLLCAMFTTPAKHHHKESQSKMKGVRRYLFMLPAWLALLAGCQQPPYQLDTSHQSPNQDARVRYLVVHYTQIDDASSLYELTRAESEVSAHYLLSREERDGVPVLYQLVPEDQRAWHAGASYWQGWRALNASSIGIEIVNLGYDPADAELPLGERRWQPYTEHQFRAVARLLLELTERYQIASTRLVGHSDISPGRKVDPGPRFPWQRLYQEYGLGAWPDEAKVQALLASTDPLAPDVASLQTMLASYGYDLPRSDVLDERTRAVISAFQLHFRPALCDGNPDRETVARLQLLLEQFNAQP